MIKENIATRCGIYCGACYIYRAERDKGDFLRETAKQQNSKLSEIKCNGCLAPEDQKWKNCKNCHPQRCLREKGLNFCYECDLFSEDKCEQYKILANFCAKRGEDVRKNMIEIKKDSGKWMQDQEIKWRCNSCGNPYSWYEKTCHHCGNNLNRLE